MINNVFHVIYCQYKLVEITVDQTNLSQFHSNQHLGFFFFFTIQTNTKINACKNMNTKKQCDHTGHNVHRKTSKSCDFLGTH